MLGLRKITSKARPAKVLATYQCDQGTIKVTVLIGTEQVDELFQRKGEFSWLFEIAKKVYIEIFPADETGAKMRFTVTGREALAAFGGCPPCSDTYQQIVSQLVKKKEK
ncbi:MAG: hypothetical protein HYR84_05420 [Planctomycetes bacterium]|nr:hypothetical protein [Planctomycetota bacterium]